MLLAAKILLFGLIALPFSYYVHQDMKRFNILPLLSTTAFRSQNYQNEPLGFSEDVSCSCLVLNSTRSLSKNAYRVILCNNHNCVEFHQQIESRYDFEAMECYLRGNGENQFKTLKNILAGCYFVGAYSKNSQQLCENNRLFNRCYCLNERFAENSDAKCYSPETNDIYTDYQNFKLINHNQNGIMDRQAVIYENSDVIKSLFDLSELHCIKQYVLMWLEESFRDRKNIIIDLLNKN